MYCPTCAHENQPDIKFCTRCGGNLALVAEVISGKLTGGYGGDQRIVNLLKDYYNGRRTTLLGSLFLLIGILLGLAPMMAGKTIDDIPFVALVGLGCLIYGAICVVWGIEHWMDSSSEMKALEIAMPRNSLKAGGKQLDFAPVESEISFAKNYSTDPIAAPPSVTEQTTRKLEREAATASGETKGEL